MKILITGNAGSGKSTLAKKLSYNLSIPLYGLDKIVWQENWCQTPKMQKHKLINEITDKAEWIIDGVSPQATAKADMVVFLDIPLYRCIINIIIRFIKNGFGTREGLPNNCPEYRGVFKAIKIAMVFNRVTKPFILDNNGNNKFIRVKNYKELSVQTSPKLHRALDF